MVVLKSATLNSRFLNSTPTGQHATPAASGTATAGASGTAAVTAPAQSSKLKFTTTRGSVLRGTREASPVPASTDGTAGGGGGAGAAADKKVPVWNKGMPVKKSAKDYTDEELKAMHGISLVSRTVTDSNHNRWDDSDEDDNWEDTIDFGDGTKVVVSKAQPIAAPSKPVEPKPVAASAVQKPAVIEQVARTVTPSARPVAAASPAPAVSSKPAGNPWKKPESTTSQAGSLSKVAHHDFPAVGESAPPSSLANDASRRDRAGSLGRPDQGDRTHYQYEQNSYDRRWQQPQPATREIFNYNTGQFEQIDATKGRRSSQHESQGRARPGLLQKIAASVTKDANARRASKEGAATTSAASLTEQAKSPTAAPAIAAAVAPEKASVPVAPAEPAAPALDPSSSEFIEMQKNLMADSRAQAILRRQQQDEEETARKERARKKAQELADKAEKEAAAEKAAKEAQVAKAKQETVARQQAKVQAQKEAADAAAAVAAEAAKKKDKEKHAASAMATAASPADKNETWHRGVKLPPLRRESQDTRPKKPAMTGPVSSFQRAPEDVPITGEAEAAQQRNVWGPIGPKQQQQQQQQQQNLQSQQSQTQSAQQQQQQQQQQQNKLNGQSKVFTPKTGHPDRALSASPATQSLPSEPTQSTWNAFDGIASKSSRPQVSLPGSSSKDRPSTDSWKQQTAFKKQSDAASPLPVQTQGGAREYVFDAADEVLPLERNTKQSPGGAAQTSRTSSRFFPSAAGNAIRRPETGASQDSMTSARGFVSPSMPPNFAEADLFEDSDVPALKLPAPAKQQQQTGGRPQQQAGPPLRASLQKVLQAMRAKMKPQQAALTEREIYGKLGLGWLETQTRAMWEAMPAKGLDKPRVSITKEGRGKAAAAQTTTTSTTATAGSGRTPWALPTHLEVMSRTEAMTEPIVPPKPSLALPSHSPSVSPIKQRVANSREQGRTFPTTRPDLLEAPDFNSPIRIKTNGAAQQAVRVPRKYGKRLEMTKQDKKATDVQRQPKNMSDHGQGHGFHRGFADRVRSPAKTPPTAQTPTLAAPVAVPAVHLAVRGGGPPGIHASTMGQLDGRAASFTPRQPPGF